MTFFFDTEQEAADAWNLRAELEERALTLEKLLEMHGEPVYCIEQNSAVPREAWGIICVNDFCANGFLIRGTPFSFAPALYDKWLAYIRKPKESIVI